ncbi:MAG: hypothetical protein FWF28_07985, partial [Micrococcales bacterium]|nr:hypothetical protein [Micrococcales bacterium]
MSGTGRSAGGRSHRAAARAVAAGAALALACLVGVVTGASPALAAAPAVTPNHGPLAGGTTVSMLATSPSDPDIVQIAAGAYSSAALAADGTVWTWGYNNYGQLGNGNKNTKTTPSQVGGLLTGVDVVQIANGGTLMAAVSSDGAV